MILQNSSFLAEERYANFHARTKPEKKIPEGKLKCKFVKDKMLFLDYFLKRHLFR
jgi:hypothetical protein